MYYLVKGNWRGEEDSSFEWVIKAESEKEALAEIDDNCEVNEIRVISAEERIEREKEALFEDIRREYILNHYGDCSIREYTKARKQMEEDKELYYDALVEYSKSMRLKHRLLPFIDEKTMTVSEFRQALSALCQAKTDEEFNAVWAAVKKH